MENLDADAKDKIDALTDCVLDLQKFFRGERTEFRDMKWMIDPSEGPNVLFLPEREYEGGGMVEVLITIDQLQSAEAELSECARKIDAGEIDTEFIALIRERTERIHQLVTCEAANLRYFDLWRATHNQNLGCGMTVACACIGTATISALIKSESQYVRTIGYVLIGLVSLSAVLKCVEERQSPQAESDRIRKRMHALFKREKEGKKS